MHSDSNTIRECKLVSFFIPPWWVDVLWSGCLMDVFCIALERRLARKIFWRGKLIDSSSGINSCRTGRGWTQPIISLHSLKHLLIWRFSHLEPLANRRFQIDSAHPGRKAWSPLQEGPGPALRPWMLQWGSWCSLVQIFVSQMITPCNFF